MVSAIAGQLGKLASKALGKISSKKMKRESGKTLSKVNESIKQLNKLRHKKIINKNDEGYLKVVSIKNDLLRLKDVEGQLTPKELSKHKKTLEKLQKQFHNLHEKKIKESVDTHNKLVKEGKTIQGKVKHYRKKPGETDEEFLKRTKSRKYGGKVIKRSTGGYINGNDLISSIYK